MHLSAEERLPGVQTRASEEGAAASREAVVPDWVYRGWSTYRLSVGATTRRNCCGCYEEGLPGRGEIPGTGNRKATGRASTLLPLPAQKPPLMLPAEKALNRASWRSTEVSCSLSVPVSQSRVLKSGFGAKGHFSYTCVITCGFFFL